MGKRRATKTRQNKQQKTAASHDNTDDKNHSRSRAATWIALAVVFGFALLLRYPIADIPLERDEGEYAYIAQRWLLGDVPYKESFDQKPPGAFVAYALIIRLIGTSPAAIHWATQLYTLGTIASLFFLGRKLFSSQVAIVAAAFCALLVAEPSMSGNASNTEVFMILPLIGAMYTAILAMERESVLWSFLTGLISVVALMFKQVALFSLAFYLIFVGLRSKKWWIMTGSLMLGVVAGILPICLYFLSAGAWSEFYDCTIGHNLSYSARVSLSEYPENFRFTFSSILSDTWPLCLLAAFALFTAVLRKNPSTQILRENRQSVLLVIGWLVFSFFGVAAGGYFREHYFIQIVPMLALLAGAGVSAIHIRGRVPIKSKIYGVIAVIAIVICVLRASWYYGPGSSYLKSRRLYGYNPFPESIAVSRFIADRSGPNDTVFIFGSEPQILYYGRLKSASRYILANPLMTAFEDTQARQQSVLRELYDTKPKFIVTVFVPTSFTPDPNTPQDLTSGLLDLLSQSYRVVAVVRFGQGDRPPEFITGERAEKIWRKTQIWYYTEIWGPLAVWQRTQ